MNKHFQKVLGKLKPKVKHLGFSKKELKSAAANIADNLELEDNASDEDIDSAIDEAIESAMQFLALSQSAAQRAISNYMKEHNISEEGEEEDEDEGGETGTPSTKGKSNQSQNNPSNSSEGDDDAMPKWAKKLFDSVNASNERLAKLEKGNLATGRKDRLRAIVKGTEKWGERKMKEFDRIASTFKDDDEFDDYLEEVKEELNEVNQERANQGLKKLGPSAAIGAKQQTNGNGGSESDEDKPETMSEKELESLANMF